MKKYISFIFTILCILSLVGCGKKDAHEIEILIPAGSTAIERTEHFDGEISSEVDGSEKPAEDNQSNFGTRYGYQYVSHEGIIEIYMNDKWWVFATEKALASSQMMIEPELSKEERRLSSYFPPEFVIIDENWTQENGWKEMPYVMDGKI